MAPPFIGTCPYCGEKTRAKNCPQCGRRIASALRAKARKHNHISGRRQAQTNAYACWRRYEYEGYPANHDAIGYRMEDFVPVLKAFIDKYNKLNPQRQDKKSTSWRENPGVEWLATQSGVNSRYIRYLLAYQQSFVSLTQADKLLTAMGQTQLVRVFELIPNPRWSRKRFEAWQAFTQELSLTSDLVWID